VGHDDIDRMASPCWPRRSKLAIVGGRTVPRKGAKLRLAGEVAERLKAAVC